MRRAQPIQPVHHSLGGKRMTPYHMERAPGMGREQYEAMVNIAVSIFTDCTNAGVSFQDSLLAVYLSGLQHAHAISKLPPPPAGEKSDE